ncbi:phage portal protein [Vibrio sp. SCSIO 43136]|uniref:phage portal protein n=1 Tax=Vibrio sp. SCSIO 43136 TaxID=2819101 RepID=UPI0020755DEC|nr:phage portal protein [Vibrio sp. SCSIO 43136]USD68129.1 phage portal protein [Vibrio sp. SCSIO 43136]
MITSLFDLESRSEPQSQTSIEVGSDVFEFGSLSEAGVVVTPATALQLAAVFSSVQILASSMAQLPLHVLRKKDNKVSKATDHAAYYLLHDSPNEWQTSFEFREQNMLNILSSGNGVSKINRNFRGELTSIEYIERENFAKPQRVTNTRRYMYPVWDDIDKRQTWVRPDEIIHIKSFGGVDKRWGMSPITVHAESLGLGLAAQKYGNQFFGSGGRPNGILVSKSGGSGTNGETQRANLKKAWNSAGIGKGGGRTALLHGDIDYKPITVTPEEAQFLATRKFNRSEIAGIYNVPPHMIGDLERATFSNISEQAIQFVTHSIMPWVTRHEQEYNRKIFTPDERRAGFYVKFNLGGLLRGTPKDRALFYQRAIHDGWMDRNEVREMEDLNPRDGLDELLISANCKLPSQLKQEGKKR